MKKGLILYVTEGKELLKNKDMFPETALDPEAASTSITFSESDVAYAWWEMITKGIQTIFCVHVSYKPQMNALQPIGTPVRIFG